MISNRNSGGQIAYEPKREKAPQITKPNSGSIPSTSVATTKRGEEKLKILKVGDKLQLVKVKN